jgi:putative restriction endonuclease
VEAAHLIQFAENYDDDPRNGIALSPTYHDVMDANIIAPGPDLKWHVSPLIDPRIPDNRDLCALAGQRILLPRDKRYYPRKDALESRLKKLTR